ncbi:MAG: hypothetical protein P4L90_04345, partial [Rhodopila sp.]|nr:hypothetical protein [Rhodopila sp.]
MLDFQPTPEVSGRIVKTSGTTGKQKVMRNSSIGVRRAVDASRIMYDSLRGSYNFLCLYQFT